MRAMDDGNRGDDSALVFAARAGDEDAYALLVNAHAPRLLGLARRLLTSEEDAEDAVQEAFLRAYRALGSFRGDAAFGTWLYRIALNTCRDAARVHTRLADERRVRESESRILDAAYTVDAAQVIVAAEQRELLETALAALPLMYREAVLLHDSEGFTMTEVAAMTGVPVSTAKSRLRRGRLLVVDILAGRPQPGQRKEEMTT